jgi:hypothetical protein
VVRYEIKRRSVVKHIGSAHDEDTLAILLSEAERTVYRLLPKLITHQPAIETATIDLVRHDLKESFSLVLYDVTTLNFESFKEYDFQRPLRKKCLFDSCAKKPVIRPLLNTGENHGLKLHVA